MDVESSVYMILLYVCDIWVWSLEYVSWIGHIKFWTCEAKVFHDSIMSFEYVICKLAGIQRVLISIYFLYLFFFLNINTNYVLCYYCRWFTMEQVSIVLSFSNGSRRMQFTRFRSLFHKKVENVETFSIYKWKYF